MKIHKLFEIFVIVCLFINYANSIKIKESPPVKYTQATCKHYHKECADFKDIIHPEHSVSMTREQLLAWLINANPNVIEEQLIKFIDHLVEQGSVLILPEDYVKPKLSTSGDENGFDIDIITKVRLTEEVATQNKNIPSQPNDSEKESSSNSSNTKEQENTSTNSNQSNENESINNPEKDIDNSNSGSAKPTSTSNSDSNKPKTDSKSNDQSSTNNTTSDNSNANSGSNTSNTESTSDKAKSDIPTEIKKMISKIPVSSLENNNVDLSNIEPAQNEFYDYNYIHLATQSTSSDSSSTTSTTTSTTTPSSTTEIIKESNDVQQQDFNQDRDERGWLYQGKLGVTFDSEGVVRCGNESISIYLLVPKNLSYDTKTFIVPLTGDQLSVWNSSQINCYSNTIDIPLIEVASENEVIEESTKNRLCCLGRNIELEDGTKQLIRTRYFELKKSKTMSCDATTWDPLYTNRFKIQDLSNPGMNSCYCGVLGS